MMQKWVALLCKLYLWTLKFEFHRIFDVMKLKKNFFPQPLQK